MHLIQQSYGAIVFKLWLKVILLPCHEILLIT